MKLVAKSANFKTAMYQDYFSRPRRWKLTRTDRTALFSMLACLLAFRLLLTNWPVMSDTTEATYADISNRVLVDVWPLGAQVFTLLFSAGLLCVVYLFVRHLFGSDLALICISVLASSELLFRTSVFHVSDMFFTLGTTLSMCAFFIAVTNTERTRLWESGIFIGLTIGLLAKGSVAIVVTGFPILIWLLSGKFWYKLRNIHWVNGLLLLVLLTLPLYFVAERAAPQSLRYYLQVGHFGASFTPDQNGFLSGSGHAQSWGTAWMYACLAFLPWTLFAGTLFWKITDIGEQTVDDTQGWHSYLFLWVISPVLLFTPTENVLPAHVLPSLPAASILLSTLWMGFHDKLDRKTRLLFLTANCGAVAVHLCIAALYSRTVLVLFS